MLAQFAPAAGSSLLMSATTLVDQSFAANLPPGSVSAVSYGSKLAAVLASILVVVVSTLALPVFSRYSAESDLRGLRRAFLITCLSILVFTVPLAAVLSLGASPIISMLFERGSFSAEDVALAASVQQFQAWHLPAYIVSIAAVRALAAIGQTWIMLIGSVANLAADVLVNTTLVPRLGIPAIGIASVAMYLTSAVVLSTGFLWRIRRRISA